MTKLLFIRPARVDERDALEALRERATTAAEDYRGHTPTPSAEARISTARIAKKRVLVVEGDEQIIGFAAWTQTKDRAAELEGLFVEPSWWRQGMGRRLVEAVASSIGNEVLRVTAAHGETAFFERCGFVTSRKVETESGSAVRMERRQEDVETASH